MNLIVPTWPKSLPRKLTPALRFSQPIQTYTMADAIAMEHERRVFDREARLKNSVSYRFLKYARTSDFTALATFTAEAALTSGNNQPWLEAGFFNFDQPTRALRLYGDGVVSTTATPTYTFSVRIGSTAASVAGTSLGISAAITTASGVTNVAWSFYMDIVCTTTIGIGAGNTTISCCGFVKSPAGFAAPYEYSLIPSQGALTTFTATLDPSVNNYLNVSVACSASSGSNTITLKRLFLETLN